MSPDRNLYLIAADGTPGSRDTIRYAGPLLDPERHEILGLRVIDPTPLDTWPWEDLEALGNPEPALRELETEAATQLRKDFEPMKDRDFEVELHVEQGEAGDVICQTAARHNVRGIFMGRRDRDGNGNVLIGSVSNYVLHHAPCPVLIVPRMNDPVPERAPAVSEIREGSDGRGPEGST